jgi:branched-chain amino acid transport system substrate-binding protein
MKASLTRRQILKGTAGAGAALTLGAPAVLAQSRAPIRLGFISSLTGAAAYQAENNLHGMSIYFDSIGWTVAGRKIELIKEDDQFNPQVGLQKAKKLVESDNVDLLVGIQASNVALAVMNYAKQQNAMLVISGAGANAITWDPYPFLFRTSLSTSQLSVPMADWAYANVAKEAVTIGSDYAGGRDVMADFKAPFEAKGGRVVKEMFPPLGSKDFSPYLAEIRAMAPPLVYAFMPGIEIVRFVQQFSELQLQQKTTLSGFALADSATIKNLGRAALGALTSTIYADTVDNPENKQFVAAYRARTNDYPDLYADYGFVTARVIAEALKATDGNAQDKQKLADAMLKVSFNAPRGPFRFDPATHNPIQDVYICKLAELEGGRIGNQIVGSVKSVKDPGKKR